MGKLNKQKISRLDDYRIKKPGEMGLDGGAKKIKPRKRFSNRYQSNRRVRNIQKENIVAPPKFQITKENFEKMGSELDVDNDSSFDMTIDPNNDYYLQRRKPEPVSTSYKQKKIQKQQIKQL